MHTKQHDIMPVSCSIMSLCRISTLTMPFAGALLSTNQSLESGSHNAAGSKSFPSKPVKQQHCNGKQTAEGSVSGELSRREASSMHRQQMQWQRAGSRLQRTEVGMQEGSVSIEM